MAAMAATAAVAAVTTTTTAAAAFVRGLVRARVTKRRDDGGGSAVVYNLRGRADATLKSSRLERPTCAPNWLVCMGDRLTYANHVLADGDVDLSGAPSLCK